EQKKVTEILAGNFNDEFELLWDYANELRAKNPSSTIKMAVKRKKEIESYEFSFWEIVKATIEKDSEDKFEAPFKKDEKVAEELKSKSPKHWTKAFFDCHSKFDMVRGPEAFVVYGTDCTSGIHIEDKVFKPINRRSRLSSCIIRIQQLVNFSSPLPVIFPEKVST
ncbi:hypothetical protein Golob_024851, partial [Gossypium lobatum]|nr:hypothetical protein [Gossypium lobatum]